MAKFSNLTRKLYICSGLFWVCSGFVLGLKPCVAGVRAFCSGCSGFVVSKFLTEVERGNRMLQGIINKAFINSQKYIPPKIQNNQNRSTQPLPYQSKPCSGFVLEPRTDVKKTLHQSTKPLPCQSKLPRTSFEQKRENV